MPHGIAKKLKEMNNKDNKKEKPVGGYLVHYTPVVQPRTPEDVALNLSFLDASSQELLFALMQTVLEIGKSATKAYALEYYNHTITYFAPIFNVLDLDRTLTSFQLVSDVHADLNSSNELFWPGRGVLLSETYFSASWKIINCLHPNTEIANDAWGQLSKCIRQRLSTWEDKSINDHVNSTSNLSKYSSWDSFQKEKKELISKINHIASAMPEIAMEVNAWAEAKVRQELELEQQRQDDELESERQLPEDED